ncbi:DUF378 domain-containing protein [Gottfriedia luciferensis]|uniref:DUF378 domain-containing protein n=1 Tax=Gottfriedia luciferensis TaxID=178774 RepID=UPI000B44DC10|nr:DUF378 domain-containing protein [Gottfriedia luciferensis]
MKTLDLLALILIIVGGVNWLLVGLFKWDLVGGIFGGMDSVFARIVYILVGLAAIYSFKLLSKVSK